VRVVQRSAVAACPTARLVTRRLSTARRVCFVGTRAVLPGTSRASPAEQPPPAAAAGTRPTADTRRRPAQQTRSRKRPSTTTAESTKVSDAVLTVGMHAVQPLLGPMPDNLSGKLVYLLQGRRSLWDSGDDVLPIFGLGDIITNAPLNISRVISATFNPCNIFLIS